jgi:hypothetical protein
VEQIGILRNYILFLIFIMLTRAKRAFSGPAKTRITAMILNLSSR